jgi:UMF1 family MFS transporter
MARMSKPQRSWVLYDVANSAFTMLATTILSIYFTSLVTSAGLAAEDGLVFWGSAETVISLIVAVAMPFLGSLADYHKNKKKFLIAAIGTGVVACVGLSVPVGWTAFLVIYMVAAVGYNSSLVFSDAFLVDVAEERDYDSISAKGYAWGYIGSLVPFIACIALIMAGPQTGLISTVAATRVSFIITAVWWAVLSIPIIKDVHQRYFKPKEEHLLASTLRGFVATLKNIVATRALLLFLIAFFFYIDGVHTIIKMAIQFGSTLGLSSTLMMIALVVTQLVAFPSALVYGKLAGIVGARRMLIGSIVAYLLITLFAAFFIKEGGTWLLPDPRVGFWILAVVVGLVQGGIQALSRSYFGTLIPDKTRSNEYFAFFSVFLKYATILGTGLMALLTWLTGNVNIGILSISVLFVVGLVFLLLTPKPEGTASS